MGQEVSSPIDPDTPPETLKARTLEALADYIENGGVKKVVVLTGAGISTSAGIPDFRSPETGLYANLARLNLPFPEAVFEISYFRNNPLPFYTLARELHPGKFFPTVAHSFVELLWRKQILLKVFTQNIDCLERKAGVPDEAIVEAHGSFATQRCIDCKTPYPLDLMEKAVEDCEVPYCMAPQCNGLVKPDIVFFGEALPETFFQNRTLPAAADLCIVMGTSLSVQPFASLPQFCAEGVPRLLINKEQVGGLGSRADDVLLLGDCDTGVRKLADALGWREELEALWKNVNPQGAIKKARELQGEEEAKLQDDALEAQISKLTEDIDESLKLSREHIDKINGQLASGKRKMEQTSKAEAGMLESPHPSMIEAPTAGRLDALRPKEQLETNKRDPVVEANSGVSATDKDES